MRAPTLAVAIIALILGADAVLVAQRKETVSEWYARQITRPATAIPMVVAHGYLVAHLCGHPRSLARFDPLSRAAGGIRYLTARSTP